jgi:uncharacterized protein with HEPN domain
MWKFRVVHILNAIGRIDRYIADMTFSEFQRNDLVVDGVIKNFIVIGEAARHLPPDVAARYPLLPIAEMRAMRNVVVHNYDNVRLVTLWETARNDLPPLIPILLNILEQEVEGEANE